MMVKYSARMTYYLLISIEITFKAYIEMEIKNIHYKCHQLNTRKEFTY